MSAVKPKTGTGHGGKDFIFAERYSSSLRGDVYLVSSSESLFRDARRITTSFKDCSCCDRLSAKGSSADAGSFAIFMFGGLVLALSVLLCTTFVEFRYAVVCDGFAVPSELLFGGPPNGR